MLSESQRLEVIAVTPSSHRPRLRLQGAFRTPSYSTTERKTEAPTHQKCTVFPATIISSQVACDQFPSALLALLLLPTCGSAAKVYIWGGMADPRMLRCFHSPRPTLSYQFNPLTFSSCPACSGLSASFPALCEVAPLPFSWSLQHGSPKTLGGPWPTCSRSTWDLLPCVASASLIRYPPIATEPVLARLHGAPYLCQPSTSHTAWWAVLTNICCMSKWVRASPLQTQTTELCVCVFF